MADTPDLASPPLSVNPNRQYTLDAQIKCVRRELAMRKRLYPGWVMSGRMKAGAAEHEINCLQAVHDILVSYVDSNVKALRDSHRRVTTCLATFIRESEDPGTEALAAFYEARFLL